MKLPFLNISNPFRSTRPPARPAVIQALPLGPAETIIAPFHDPQIAPSLPFRVAALEASRCTHEFFWCWTILKWAACPAGRPAAILTLDLDLHITRYDELIFSLVLSPETGVRFEACFDGEWRTLGEEERGTHYRMEIHRSIVPGHLTGVRATFTAYSSDYTLVCLSWFGLAEKELVARLEAVRPRWDPSWPGLIRPRADWPPPKFACGLLFGEKDLPALRKKKNLPGWQENFAVLESKARSYLQRQPEDDCGEYLPWSDYRYLRDREKNREPYFLEALVLGFVGLVNEDQAMCEHALRYLMCMAHTTHWTQSAESRVLGSAWDQRAYLEEMTVTSCALLLDWFDAALSRRAKSLLRTVIWDKGLAFVERDLFKHENLHHANQGPTFCRGRVLAGLLLERTWPRFKEHTDRGLRDLQQGLENYILADGGLDEGMGYFSITLHSAMHALLAYSRQRSVDVKTLLPRNIRASEQFLAIMSAVEPGNVLMDGDNSTDYLIGDTVPIMAGLFQESVYSKILGACLARERPFTYYNHFVVDGLFGFVFGPSKIGPVECIVPTFAIAPHAGQLTSLRRRAGRSIRIHLAGAKARPSHSHFDKGNFTVEIDGVGFLIDRGIVRYDDLRAGLVKRSCMHNVITPYVDGIFFPDQAFNEKPVIPRGTGDAERLEAAIDLSDVWRDHMSGCRREIVASSFESFTVKDEGSLQQATPVAFHLQSSFPFHIEGNVVTLTDGTRSLQIMAPWAKTITQREELVDFALRPVHHLVIASEAAKKFSLKTDFTVTFADVVSTGR